ncbi:hypothetical protein CDIK_2920 [Cucumispora dikerogammari]|nr:hypothetical protein CDIK_2920 [Cucumispora dikerogammari]
MFDYIYFLFFNSFGINIIATEEQLVHEKRAKINVQPRICVREIALAYVYSPPPVQPNKKKLDILFWIELKGGYKTDNIKIYREFNQKNLTIEACSIIDLQRKNKRYQKEKIEKITLNIKKYLYFLVYKLESNNKFIGIKILQQETEKENPIIEYLNKNANKAVRFNIELETKSTIDNKHIFLKTEFRRLIWKEGKPELIGLEGEEQASSFSSKETSRVTNSSATSEAMESAETKINRKNICNSERFE